MKPGQASVKLYGEAQRSADTKGVRQIRSGRASVHPSPKYLLTITLMTHVI